MDKIKQLLKLAINSGLPLPHAYDPVPKEPSFRLLVAYVSFLIAASSVVALHFWHVEVATWTSIAFFGLCMVFYMLKKLSKAKIDIDDRSVELESEKSE